MAEATVTSNKTFRFDLISPERVLASENVTMVTVPGEAGEFGVLADHAPLLSSLRAGVVKVKMPSGEEKRVFVAGGFADVGGNACSVLAEGAVNVNELDRGEIEARLKNLRGDLDFAKDDTVKHAQISRQIKLAEAQLAAVS